MNPIKPTLTAVLCLALFGCGSHRSRDVIFDDTTPPSVPKKFSEHFESVISKHTTAYAIAYRIEPVIETALLSSPGTEASATVWSQGRSINGTILWNKTVSASARWRFTGTGFSGGSVYSCLDDIAKKLP